MNLYEYIKHNDRLDLLLEWDREANKGLDPTRIRPYSKERVHWVCEKGHRWETAVNARVCHRSGCPYCSGLNIVPGETDLLTTCPDAAVLWHPTKNGALTPKDVGPKSHKSVWWQCEQGHEWEARVYAVTNGSRCPYCSGYKTLQGKTDLRTTHPELAAEWDEEKNRAPADSVSAGSAKKVWWRCEKGHSYQQVVYSRVAGCGCPYCAGKKVLAGFNDLATTDPELVSEWADERIKPTEINRGSHKAAKWRCPLGHEYESPVYAKVAGNGCPYCTGRKVLAGFNDLATTHPKLAAQWDEALNGELRPETVTKGSNKKVWWRCGEGHVWKAAVFSRTRVKGSGCPVCAGQVKLRFEDNYNRDRALRKMIAPTRVKAGKGRPRDGIAV